jgi:hypothetical protein
VNRRRLTLMKLTTATFRNTASADWHGALKYL